MQHVVLLSHKYNAGCVYITDDTLPNLYDTLPSNPYWSDKLSLVKDYN